MRPCVSFVALSAAAHSDGKRLQHKFRVKLHSFPRFSKIPFPSAISAASARILSNATEDTRRDNPLPPRYKSCVKQQGLAGL